MEEVARQIKGAINHLALGMIGAFFATIIVIQIYDNNVDDAFTLKHHEWKCTSMPKHGIDIDQNKCDQWTRIRK